MYRRKKENLKRSQQFPTKLSPRQPGKVIKDFCESTSLHGYSYLYIADTFFMKMVWIFVIIVMTGLGVVFLTINTDAYIKARLVTNIESSTAKLQVKCFLKKYLL